LKYLYLVITSLLALCPLIVKAVELEMSTPNAAVSLPLEGRKGSTFYTVDGDRFNVVVAFTVGSGENEQLIRQVVQLIDGQTYRVSIGGFGADTKATTIRLKRKDKVVRAKIITCANRETIANCI
jgi:hypothetical protein